ncbi:MAG: glycosyltransferase [Candidatus Schekmanbacteria bacterium]|nr:glycosyltransferase [Candidatus Schekmanbacteria bacterium]
MSAIAIVVQRFGADVFGGAEAHARQTADSLRSSYAVDVLTTCARDYTRWENHYAPGVTDEDGVRVHRFPVTGLRAPSFDLLSFAFYNVGADENDERIWLEAQGPVAPGLLDHLGTHGDQYEAVIYYTYLYHPTVEGIRRADKAAILVPTCHDEPPLRFDMYRGLFRRAKALLFLTPEEQQLVETRFAAEISGTPRWVLGAPVAVPAGVPRRGDAPPAELATAVPGFQLDRPFTTYVGRLDEGKGCGELIGFHLAGAEDGNGTGQLLLIGRHHMAVPEHPTLFAPGPMSEACKWWALSNAAVTIVPSRMESLCLLALESWAVGTPALCVAGEVLKGHVLRSGAGLCYDSEAEFHLALALLLGDAELRATIGARGRAYVNENYSPERFDGVLRAAIGTVAGTTGGDNSR